MIIIVKDILSLLKEMAKTRHSKKTTILECKEDIIIAINAGYSLREIWTVLQQTGRVTYTYSGFLKAVKKYIVIDHKEKFTSNKNPDSVSHAPAPPSPEPASNMPVVEDKPRYKVARIAKPVEHKKHVDCNEMEEVSEEQQEKNRLAAEALRKGSYSYQIEHGIKEKE